MKNFGDFATNYVIYNAGKQHQMYITVGIFPSSTTRNTTQMFPILWKYMNEILFNVTVIAFCVIRKVDYLIVDLHTQTLFPFISEYWYFHTYWYIHQRKQYQKTQRNIPTEITLNLRLIITFLTSSDKWLEIQEECLAQSGVICYAPSTESNKKVNKKYKYYFE